MSNALVYITKTLWNIFLYRTQKSYITSIIPWLSNVDDPLRTTRLLKLLRLVSLNPFIHLIVKNELATVISLTLYCSTLVSAVMMYNLDVYYENYKNESDMN